MGTRKTRSWRLCIALLAGALLIPSIRGILELQMPSLASWMLILTASLLPLLLGSRVIRYTQETEIEKVGAEVGD